MFSKLVTCCNKHSFQIVIFGRARVVILYRIVDCFKYIRVVEINERRIFVHQPMNFGVYRCAFCIIPQMRGDLVSRPGPIGPNPASL